MHFTVLCTLIFRLQRMVTSSHHPLTWQQSVTGFFSKGCPDGIANKCKLKVRGGNVVQIYELPHMVLCELHSDSFSSTSLAAMLLKECFYRRLPFVNIVQHANLTVI